MLSNIFDRISFWSLYLVVVLLPIFFLPFTKIPVETSKSLVLVVGLVISVMCWAAARFSDGKIVLPKSWILVSGLGIVAAFLVSALVSGTRQNSMFGVMFDIGTFWSIFSAYVLMLFSSIIFKDKKNARVLLLGVLTSFFVLFVFQIFHIFFPNTLAFGSMIGKTGNLAGSWNSLGLLAVLGIIISLFLIEFYSVSKVLKIALGAFLALAMFMNILVNFPLAWELLGFFATFVFIYKISFYSTLGATDKSFRKFPAFSFIVVLISLLFFISGQFIGSYLPDKFGISNIEVSPTFSSTMYVANGVLKGSPIFGMGPNNFDQAWAKFKSPLINNSQYWNTSFYTGSGLIPTFFVTTGGLGVLTIILFFYLLFTSGAKKLFINMKSSENVEITMFFISTAFLAAAATFYAAGIVVFLLLFAFSGVFIGLSSTNREGGEISISFLEDPRKSFFSIIVLVVIMILSAGLSFKYIERFASAQYFGKALLAENTQDSLKYITRSIELDPNDLYYRTYSQVELLLISQAAEKSKGTSLTEEEKATVQDEYNQALQGATLATNFNPKNSLNWQSLAGVYHTVSNLGLTDVYDKAIESYKTAATLNPLDPSIKLSIASVYLSKGMNKEAKDYGLEAIKLKPNYTEGLLMMSQISRQSGNNNDALSFAQQALQTLPTNKDLINYVESLKNNSSTVPSANEQIPSTTPKKSSKTLK